MTNPERVSYCPHRTPVSNGWTSYTSQITGEKHVSVYCGRCHVDVDVSQDQEWNQRYFEARGYYPLGEPPRPKRGRKTA